MRGQIILKGHKISQGKTRGEALVSNEPISFLSGVDPETGCVIEKGHELEGSRVTGKILVFPTGKGSTVGSYRLYEMTLRGTQPAGIINVRADPVVAMGAIFSDIPMLDRLNADPFTFIKTGDVLELDADDGILIIEDSLSNAEA